MILKHAIMYITINITVIEIKIIINPKIKRYKY